MGRPAAFNVEIAERLVREKRKGVTHLAAAKAVGITDRTLYAWLERGDSGEVPFDAFSRAFRKAQDDARRATIAAAARRLGALALA